MAKQGQGRLVQQENGEGVDPQDLLQFVERQVLEGVQLDHAGTGDDNVNVVYALVGLKALHGLEWVGPGGRIDLDQDHLRVLALGYSEQTLRTVQVAHSGDYGVVWLGNVMIKDATPDACRNPSCVRWGTVMLGLTMVAGICLGRYIPRFAPVMR